MVNTIYYLFQKKQGFSKSTHDDIKTTKALFKRFRISSCAAENRLSIFVWAFAIVFTKDQWGYITSTRN